MKKSLFLIPLISFSIIATGYILDRNRYTPKDNLENNEIKSTPTSEQSLDSKVSKPSASNGKNQNAMISPSISNIDPVSPESNDRIALPDFIPAQTILKEIRTDLSDANLDCNVSDPKKNALISLPGNESDGTLATCIYGDPEGDGFVVYVVTEKNFVSKYNSEKYLNFFREFQSPIDGLAENTLFTPTSKGILFVLGGRNAFQASEIAWGTLEGLQLNPPNRD